MADFDEILFVTAVKKENHAESFLDKHQAHVV
jgi:hypothetical protein